MTRETKRYFFFFFSPYYTIDLQTYDFSAIKINSDTFHYDVTEKRSKFK